MTNVVLPHINYIDNDNVDPQMVMPRHNNLGSLHIDSRLGYGPFEQSSDIMIASNIGRPGGANPLVQQVRRMGMKHLELFFYLDNIIQGYNDTLTIVLYTSTPSPFSFLFSVTLTNGVYDVPSMGAMMETLINGYLVANFGSIPIPVVTVTYTAPTISNLLGFLTFTCDILNIAIDPNCTFITNSSSMTVLSDKNTFPQPTSLSTRVNFFSLSPYNYIDIVSLGLTQNTKTPSTSNTGSNYILFHRIYSPQYGINKYRFHEPLLWTNISKDQSLFNIDFRFIDSNGQQIKGALTRNFWWLMEIALEK